MTVDLDALVDSYFAYLRDKTDALFVAWEDVQRICYREPEKGWALLQMLISAAPGQAALMYVAAGPLEEFLVDHGDAYIERIVRTARAEPRMKTALGATWQRRSMSPAVVRAMEALFREEYAVG